MLIFSLCNFCKKEKIALLFFPFIILVSSCNYYDRFESDPSVQLHFSVDTIDFDSLFSALGSTTISCKVYNRSDKNLLLDEIRLIKGANSPFLMAVEGRSGTSVRNIRLAKKDSLFLFFEVNANSLFHLLDEVVFIAKGVDLSSRLYVKGFSEDVVLIEKDTILRRNTTLTAQKPYVVQGNITVEEGVDFTILAGARVYFARQKGIIVKGRLNIRGVRMAVCHLSHLRYQEEWYSKAVGEWKGVAITANGRAVVEYARLQGAQESFAIIDSFDVATNRIQHLQLSKSILDYCEHGIYGRNASIEVDNTLIANCSKSATLIEGGEVQFYNTTIATFASGNIQYHQPQLVLQNFWLKNRDTVGAPLKEALFAGCIIYGSNERELQIHRTNRAAMQYKFKHCVLRVPSDFNVESEHFTDIKTLYPNFVNKSSDFSLQAQSPAINANSVENITLYPLDLLGVNRLEANDLTIGCYAFVP
ncbi:MAG: hypothetical protein ACRCY6_00905 [Bacteroidales bacterium]